jgi:hypothetical protein
MASRTPPPPDSDPIGSRTGRVRAGGSHPLPDGVTARHRSSPLVTARHRSSPLVTARHRSSPLVTAGHRSSPSASSSKPQIRGSRPPGPPTKPLVDGLFQLPSQRRIRPPRLSLRLGRGLTTTMRIPGSLRRPGDAGHSLANQRVDGLIRRSVATARPARRPSRAPAANGRVAEGCHHIWQLTRRSTANAPHRLPMRDGDHPLPLCGEGSPFSNRTRMR